MCRFTPGRNPRTRMAARSRACSRRNTSRYRTVKTVRCTSLSGTRKWLSTCPRVAAGSVPSSPIEASTMPLPLSTTAAATCRPSWVYCHGPSRPTGVPSVVSGSKTAMSSRITFSAVSRRNSRDREVPDIAAQSSAAASPAVSVPNRPAAAIATTRPSAASTRARGSTRSRYRTGVALQPSVSMVLPDRVYLRPKGTVPSAGKGTGPFFGHRFSFKTAPIRRKMDQSPAGP